MQQKREVKKDSDDEMLERLRASVGTVNSTTTRSRGNPLDDKDEEVMGGAASKVHTAVVRADAQFF